MTRRDHMHTHTPQVRSMNRVCITSGYPTRQTEGCHWRRTIRSRRQATHTRRRWTWINVQFASQSNYSTVRICRMPVNGCF